MCSLFRPNRYADIDNLKVGIPCQSTLHVIDSLDSNPPRLIQVFILLNPLQFLKKDSDNITAMLAIRSLARARFKRSFTTTARFAKSGDGKHTTRKDDTLDIQSDTSAKGRA